MSSSQKSSGADSSVERPFSASSLSHKHTSPSGSASSSSSCGQHPEGRQRLQRGAKDKVYATRLAADYRFDHASSTATTTVTGGNVKSVKLQISGHKLSSDAASQLRCEEYANRKRKRSRTIVEAQSSTRNFENQTISYGHPIESTSKEDCLDIRELNTPNIHEGEKITLGLGVRLPKQPLHRQINVSTSAPAPATAPAPAPPNDWSCTQCTCSNSCRRKKCQACGIPRYLMIDFDGSYRMNYDGGWCSRNNTSLAATASTDSFSSQEGKSQQQLQLFAMMDAPVDTRSRRKERLSQTQVSMTQPDERENIIDNRFDFCQSPQQHHDPQREEGGSEFQQWLRMRHTAKREKRHRAKSLTNHSISLETASSVELEEVTVRISDFDGDEIASFVKQQLCLTAYIPMAVLARISADPTTNSNHIILLETASLRDTKCVTIRINALVGDGVASFVNQQESPKNGDTEQSSHPSMLACIPLAVLARISMGPNTRPNNNVNCSVSNTSMIGKQIPKEFQRSSSCDGRTGEDSSNEGAPICIQSKYDQQLSKISIGAPMSTFDDRVRSESDTSLEKVPAVRRSEEGTKEEVERSKPIDETEESSLLGLNCQDHHQSNNSSEIANACLSNSPLTSGNQQPANKHSEKVDYMPIAPAQSNAHQSTQGSDSLDSPFIPMTQQVLDFDYLSQISQASLDTPESALNGGLQKMYLPCEPQGGIRAPIDHETMEQPSPGCKRAIRRFNAIPESSFRGGAFYNSPDPRSNSHNRVGPNHVLDTTKVRLGFTTAGSDALIPVSDESLLRATKLLADSANCLADQAHCNAYNDSTSPIIKCDYPSRMDASAQDSSSRNDPHTSLGFSNAGSGSLIRISDESLVRAAHLLAERKDCLVGRATTSDDVLGDDAVSLVCDERVQAHGDSNMKQLLSEKYSSAPFGFCTAGSGALIRVSDECLSRASTLLAVSNTIHDDDDNSISHHDKRKPSTEAEVNNNSSVDALRSELGFACAGSGALITVSNEYLSRASTLLADNNDCLIGRANSRGDEHDNDSTFETEDGVLHRNPNNQPSFSGFACAGSGSLIRISAESLSRVSKILEDDNVNLETTCEDDNDIHANSRVNDCICSSSVATNMRYSISSQAPCSRLGFASAGSGALITVSGESMQRASELLADSEDLVEKAVTCEDKNNDVVVTPANNEKHPTNSDPEKYHPMSTKSNCDTLGFACAGSGSLIRISAESLTRATALLENSDDCLVDRAITSNDANDDISYEGLPSSLDSKAVSSVATRTSLRFASAGGGSLIRISNESSSRAPKLLVDRENCFIDRAIASDGEQEDARDESHPCNMDGKTMCTASLNVRSSSFGFASAGSGASIFVSDESLSTSSKLLADCVGVTAQLCDDEQDDATLRKFDDRYPSNNDVFSDTLFFNRGEDSINCECKSGMTHGAIPSNTEDCRSRKRNGNQRVRFSLDPSQSTTNRQIISRPYSFHDEQLSNVSPSVSDSRHSIEIRSRQIGPTLLNGESLITPDNRQMEEKRIRASRRLADEKTVPEFDDEGVDTTIESNTPYRSNVVTYRKDFQTCSNLVPSSFVETMHHSPRDKCVRTPLHEITTIVEDPFPSVMKSKRLFQSTVFEGDERSKIRIPQVVDKSITREVAPSGTSTLSQFASNHHAPQASSWADCIKHGVKEATMRVSSVNAGKLRFSSVDDLPVFFLGQRDPPKCSHVGKTSDICEWLRRHECDMSLISDKWIQNHVRWIVWKLAAMERRFSVQLGGQYLTFSHVLSQIKGRYEKELRGAKRPALRKVLNRDVSAGMPIVLCVSQVLRFKTKRLLEVGLGSAGSNITEEVRLELSDGWYAVSAILDDFLKNLIEGSKVRVGSKLMICNAQLVGSDEGIDPLDQDYSSDRRLCSIYLKITANNSRLARWDAKLGFVHPKYTANLGGGILIKSLCDVIPNGGNIPALDVVVCKRYPQMYLEQVKEAVSQAVVTSHLTEAEEAARQNEHDTSHQRTSEHFADIACKEYSEEVDEDAPIEWKEMVISNFPEEYYENLTATEQTIVDDWTKKRQLLVRNKVAKSIEDSVKDQSPLERTSVPYIRVLVKSLRRSKQKVRRLAKKQNIAAELTIWRVSEEQLHLMKEGTVVRMKNVCVRSDHDGILQLSANGDTHTESLSSQSTQIQLIRSGYEERRPKSLIHINLIAKKSEPSRLSREVDVVACIVKIQRLDNNTSAAYLTDESLFVMKLTRIHSSHNTDPFQLGNLETALPAVVEFCNVTITSFDTTEQCSIGSWGIFTCKAKHFMRLRHDEIKNWCSSASGMEQCSIIVERINAGLPSCASPFNRYNFCIGYILRFDVHDISLDMNVFIDYGEEILLMARFPFNLLLHAIRITQSNSLTSDSVEFTSILAGNMFNRANILYTCNILGEYLRRNQVLFRFSLERSSCYGVDMQFHEVIGISLAATDSLCRLNAMHLARSYSLD